MPSDVLLSVIMLSIIMLSVALPSDVLLSVIMLSVVEPLHNTLVSEPNRNADQFPTH